MESKEPEKLEEYQEKLMDYEKAILQRIRQIVPSEELCLNEYVAIAKPALQRFLYALCNPAQFIYARKWSKFDLATEVKKMEEMHRMHPQYALELERWLTSQVSSVLNENKDDAYSSFVASPKEKECRLQEQKDFRARYKLFRQWRDRFEM